jgi:FixJ family two-component response regulator
MDGHELAKRLNRLRPDTKIVYMSGFFDDALSRHGLDASDIVVVQKPFAQSVLLSEVRRRLGEAKPPAPDVAAPDTAERETDEIH